MLFPLNFSIKFLILAAACVSQSRCPAHPQWLCELYNFTLFTGNVFCHAEGYFSWQVQFALICFSFRMLLSYLGRMQLLVFLWLRPTQQGTGLILQHIHVTVRVHLFLSTWVNHVMILSGRIKKRRVSRHFSLGSEPVMWLPSMLCCLVHGCTSEAFYF